MSAIVKDMALSQFVADAITKQVDSVKFKETGYGSRRKLVIEFNNAVAALFDNPGVGGQCCGKIADLPAELIHFDDMRVNLTIGRHSGTTTSLGDTFDGDIGLGTTTGVGATLSSTEQDIFATQSTPTAVAGVSTVKLVQAATSAAYDATAGKSLFLNFLVDDAEQDGSAVAATVVFNGHITIFYTVLGA